MTCFHMSHRFVGEVDSCSLNILLRRSQRVLCKRIHRLPWGRLAAAYALDRTDDSRDCANELRRSLTLLLLAAGNRNRYVRVIISQCRADTRAAIRQGDEYPFDIAFNTLFPQVSIWRRRRARIRDTRLIRPARAT